MKLPGIPRPAPRPLKVGLFASAIACFIGFTLTDWGILAVAAFASFFFLIFLIRRESEASGDVEYFLPEPHQPTIVNPATGLPLIPGTGVDVIGRPYGHGRDD